MSITMGGINHPLAKPLQNTTLKFANGLEASFSIGGNTYGGATAHLNKQGLLESGVCELAVFNSSGKNLLIPGITKDEGGYRGWVAADTLIQYLHTIANLTQEEISGMKAL